MNESSASALRNPGYRLQLSTYVLAMMADNIEHVISYWVMFQKFHSTWLGGFAVISHWVPYLLFSVPAGALGDRFDPRRLIQIGMALFMVVSLAWAWLIGTDQLLMWQAMLLLVLHGCAGVLWQTNNQILLHEVATAHQLPSAVRLMAMARSMGVLLGPALGGLMLLQLGSWGGLVLNAAFYLPCLIWLIRAPYGPAYRQVAVASKRAIRGLADIVQTARDIAPERQILVMVMLAGLSAFFVGNAYQAQMPGFAHDLGHGDPGTQYSMLLAADAFGAIVGGVSLERYKWLSPRPGTALAFCLLWCLALTGFAQSTHYPWALCALFAAGFFELCFNSIAQTVVQLKAPDAIRGRVIGFYNMAALGLRAGGGITVGLVGGWLGIHWALSAAALALMVLVAGLWTFHRRDAKAVNPGWF
jgi:MFS family permease